MKSTIYCPDIECDSCVKLLSRKFNHVEGINDIAINKDSLLFEYDAEKVKPEILMRTIQDAGFRASLEPFERKSFSERMRHVKENKDAYKLEIHALKYAVGIFLLLTILELLAYIAFFLSNPDFFAHYAQWIFYLNISVASIGSALWHFYAYKIKMTCMLGMMVGMTLGMQSGMMIGAVLGVTNGFFIGALAGMLIASFLGILGGMQVGIMGVMEGMMGGIMGGTMGAMITVMMFSDHLSLFMPFYMLLNVIITAGMIYMMYEEAVEGQKNVLRKPVDFFTFASIGVFVTAILIAVMVYGPKSPLFLF